MPMIGVRLEEREQKIMEEIMNDEEYNSLQRPTSDGGPGFTENGASQVGLFSLKEMI